MILAEVHTGAVSYRVYLFKNSYFNGPLIYKIQYSLSHTTSGSSVIMKTKNSLHDLRNAWVRGCTFL